MTRRARLLGAWLALLVAGLPVAPRLHLLLAEHLHVFCLEHGVLEHVPLGASSDRPPVSTTAHRATVGDQDDADVCDARGHQPCEASATLAPFCVDKAPLLASPAVATTVASGRLAAGFVPVALLRLAPKQSPPRDRAG